MTRVIIAALSIVVVLIVLLWTITIKHELRHAWTFGDYSGFLSLGSGAIRVEAFRNDAEDEFYRQSAVPFRNIACVLALALAAMIWRERRTALGQRVSGFAVIDRTA